MHARVQENPPRMTAPDDQPLTATVKPATHASTAWSNEARAIQAYFNFVPYTTTARSLLELYGRLMVVKANLERFKHERDHQALPAALMSVSEADVRCAHFPRSNWTDYLKIMNVSNVCLCPSDSY